jgi:hypothetical protein
VSYVWGEGEKGKGSEGKGTFEGKKDTILIIVSVKNVFVYFICIFHLYIS